MKTRTILASALSIICSVTVLSAQAPSRTALVARLDSLAHEYLVDGPIVGATIAVIKGKDTLYYTGIGDQDREKHLPAGRNTVYRIGSITKQFTAAAILQLVEQGKRRLQDSLGTLLPQYPQWRSITLRQLLNHTSGIHSYTANRDWASHWNDDLTPAAIVDFVARDTFDFVPGAQFRYNNTGYVLLGMILDKVTGTPYPTYVAEHLFKPLGMTGATYCPNRTMDAAHAAGYEISGGRTVSTRYLSMTHPYSAGALCMSVGDFLKWQTALTSGKVVSSATYARMSTADTVNAGLKTGYGFALFSAKLGTHTLIHHGGDVHGFSAQQLWLPDDSLRVVVFTNTLGSNPDFLARNLASAVLGEPLRTKPRLPPAVPLATTDRTKYLGTYNLVPPGGAALPLRVFVEGDVLLAQAVAPGQGKFPLVYVGNDTFASPVDLSIRITFTIENGVATKARLTQSGNTIEGVRQP